MDWLAFYRTAKRLSLRSLFHKKRTFALITILLAFSLLNLVFFASFAEGVAQTTDANLTKYLFADIVVEPAEKEEFIYNAGDLEKRIRLIPGVTGVSKRRATGATIRFQGRTLRTAVTSITPSNEKMVTDLEGITKLGEFLEDGDRGEILLGDEIVGNLDGGNSVFANAPLKAGVGDTVEVEFSNGVKKEFRVKGILDAHFWLTDALALIPVADMEEITGESDVATSLLIKKAPGVRAEDLKLKLLQSGVREEVKISLTDLSIGDTMKEAITIMTYLGFLVGSASAFIVVFIIIFINALQRKREIGILKALGIGKGVVLASFFFQAIVYAIAGVLLGVLLIEVVLSIIALRPMALPIGYLVPVLTSETRNNAILVVFGAALFATYVASRNVIHASILDAIWSR